MFSKNFDNWVDTNIVQTSLSLRIFIMQNINMWFGKIPEFYDADVSEILTLLTIPLTQN